MGTATASAPTLSEAAIADFEREHGIVLPEDYRLYLQLVGDGNGEAWRERTGPWARGGAGPGYGIYPLAETVCGARVNQNFPFAQKVELPDEPPYNSWEDDIPGALEISTAGCSSHSHLIVCGPMRGSIWEGYNHDNFSPTYSSFSHWMRAWAESELRNLAGKTP